MKKIMILGGNFFQMSAIKRAKELGYYVISVDYLPENPGHRFSDEYHNVSTIDKEKVLALAKELQIDGILSYASDISAPTAAYVAEKLGLPTNPYESVRTLTQKNLFRKFMRKNDLVMPEGEMFEEYDKAYEYAKKLTGSFIMKPVDSSGSKGVNRLDGLDNFKEYFEEAMNYSISNKIIIERFVKKQGYQIDGDGFIKDGKIIYFGVMDQHNNIERNPHAPIGLSTPSIQNEKVKQKAQVTIQHIFDLLNMKFGAFNFEYIISDDGEVYILEIGPRNGGNFIPDTIQEAYGIDMIEASIRAALGDEYDSSFQKSKNRICSSYVVHSLETGIFEKMEIDEAVKNKILKEVLFVQKGDQVTAFKNGGDSIGAMVLQFDSVDEMNNYMDSMWKYIRVKLK